MIRFASCLVVFVIQSVAAAQLSWDVRERTLEPKVGEGAVTAEYTFVNRTDHSITIKSLTASCDCTLVSLSKKIYKPGEGGTIVATFTVGDRQGLQNKTILVTTSDEAEQNVLLQMRVKLPVVVASFSEMVLWKRGEAAEQKVISIRPGSEGPARAPRVSSDGSIALQTSIRELTDGSGYEVLVTPDATESVGTSHVYVEADGPEGRLLYKALASVVDDSSAGSTQP